MRSFLHLLFRISIIAIFIHPSYEDVDTDNLMKEEDHYFCEMEALRVGTRLADVFNSPIEGSDQREAYFQPYIIEHLGFLGKMAYGLDLRGNSAKNISAAALRERGGWAGYKSLAKSSYWALEDQWIYLQGETTTKQLFDLMTNGTAANSLSDWSSNPNNCYKQKHRSTGKDGIPASEADSITCHCYGEFGKIGKISFDFKHSIWDNYDRWLWSSSGPFDYKHRIPDVIVISSGMHSCRNFDVSNEENAAAIQFQIDDLISLIAAIQAFMKRIKDKKHELPLIVFMTAGRLYNFKEDSLQQNIYDKCIRSFNRQVSKLVHKHNFLLFEREEIETRLLYKIEHSPELRSGDYATSMHLIRPAPQIVTTSLLAMLACLRKGQIRTPEIWSGLSFV